MAAPSAAEKPAAPSTWRVVSARYQGKTYQGGVLQVDGASREVELMSSTGRRKKEQATVAKLRLGSSADFGVDGATVRVLDLSVTLESLERANEVADLLGKPAKEQEALRRLSEVESLFREFLEGREAAMSFLSMVKADPRGTLLGARSMWTGDGGKEPLDEVRSKHSEALAESLGRAMSSASAAEGILGSRVVERICALSFVIGSVQDAAFEGRPSLADEIGALRELGVSASDDELRSAKATAKLLDLSHPVLVSIVTSAAPG